MTQPSPSNTSPSWVSPSTRINNGIIYLLADRMRMNFYLSKLFAIGTVTVWNFFMNYYFTFTA